VRGASSAGTPGPASARRGKTALSKLAAEMKPGSWATLETGGPGKLVRAPHKKGLNIMTWSDDAHWDSRTGQFFFMGLRQARRFIAYSEEKNAWRNIPLPRDHKAAGSPPLGSGFGHIYSRNALDPEKSRFYHMVNDAGGAIHRYDIASGTWTKLPAGGSYMMTGVIEYFSARKGLVNLGWSKHGLRFFSEEKQAWEKLGSVPVHGHHSMGRHNPVRQEVLLAGGSTSAKVVIVLDRDGKIKRMKDCPVPLTIRFDLITVDPVSGRYLIMSRSSRKLLEFDSAKNEYRLVTDFTKAPWPFGYHDHPVVAFIREYGVTMWVAKKVWLYKHDAVK